jgi:2-dehydro-3-deoxyphosphogluconate aldolase/(4S)-4-hydroxy-2-oxoglutarate aldolase
VSGRRLANGGLYAYRLLENLLTLTRELSAAPGALPMKAMSPPEQPLGTDVLGRVQAFGIVPVIVIDDAADAVPLAAALSGGGLACAEVTFRTAAAAEAIRKIADAFPGMLLGAGTVLTPQQVRDAAAAGARFVVAPGFNARVVDTCLESGLPVFPGVCTPTEIEMGLERGLDVLKFFPAEPMGGLSYLKAIAAPYGNVRFIPTGGIDLSNLVAYLSFDRVVACGGSWMATAASIRAKQFERIRAETTKAVTALRVGRR